jgi:hypothetical protein
MAPGYADKEFACPWSADLTQSDGRSAGYVDIGSGGEQLDKILHGSLFTEITQDRCRPDDGLCFGVLQGGDEFTRIALSPPKRGDV